MQIKGIQNLGFGALHVRYDEKELTSSLDKLLAIQDIEIDARHKITLHRHNMKTLKTIMTIEDTPEREEEIMKNYKELDIFVRRSETPEEAKLIKDEDYNWLSRFF